MLIQSFLELSPGLFAIFYHQALGKTSTKKADDRSLSFILGTEICTAIVFLATYIIVSFFITKIGNISPIFMWIMSGIFLSLALISFFFYYRPTKFKKPHSKTSKSTELFLSRRLAKNLKEHAERANNRSSTIVLGLITSALELLFTLPLYIIMSICIFYSFPNWNSILIIIYVIIATLPLFIVRTFYRTDHTLADIMRIRIKKKLLTKIILSLSYLAISIITFIIGFSL